MELELLLHRLNSLSNPILIVSRKKKFGINSSNALGISMKDLNEFIKGIPQSDELALQLFDTGIYEAKIICSKIFKPQHLTTELANYWVKEFDNWEICDSFSMLVFARSTIAQPLINQWAERDEEFVKRAAFATIAGLCHADKQAVNSIFEVYFPLILEHSYDERPYINESISWALRSIGKRNIDLKDKAISCCQQLKSSQSTSAKWIANEAINELQKDGCRISDYPRKIYR